MPDLTPPRIQNPSPTFGKTGVPVTTNISVSVVDEDSGLDATTIIIDVGGTTAYDAGGGGFQPGFTGPGSAVVAIADGVRVTIDPTTAFAVATAITVRVRADDLDSNSLDTTYSFETVPVVGGAVHNVEATLTSLARHYYALQAAFGMSWGNYTFEVGGGGFDVLDPTTAIPVDPEATGLLDSVFGPEPIDGIQIPNDYGTAIYCVLEKAEANFELGEIAVYAEVTYSPADPGLVGTTFLFAHAHHPARFKTSDSRMSYRVCVQVG